MQYKTKHDEANTQELIEINSNHFLLTYFIYFLFKYKSSNKPIQLETDSIPKESSITASGLDNNYKINFYPIKKVGVSYYIKAFYKDGLIQGEDLDTLAISESPGKYMQIYSPAVADVEQLSYEFKTDKEVNYIKIVARYDDRLINDKELYLYAPVEVKNEQSEHTDENEENGSSNNAGLYVAISVLIILVLVVIGIGIWVFIYKKRNIK